jgi:hypothetical protein
MIVAYTSILAFFVLFMSMCMMGMSESAWVWVKLAVTREQ